MTGGTAPTGGVAPAAGATTTGGNIALGGTGTGSTVASGGVPNAGASAAAGTAGKPPCGRLIDDMENRSGRLCPGAGRQGVWYVFSDGFDEVWPAAERPGVPVLPVTIPERSGGSRSAMYLSVVAGDHSGWSTSTCWGSGIGFDLNYDGTYYGVYDAGAYSGFAFWARGTAGLVVEARASTIATTLTTYGGTCLEEFCDPYFNAVTLSAEWAYYQIQFSQLKHQGWQGSYEHGTVSYAKVEFDVQQLTNLQFLVHKMGNCDTIPPQFEFWIDDVAFF